MHRLTAEMKDCIERCQRCASVCLATVTHCLEKGGRHAEAEHVRLLLDCAGICETSAGFLSRGSDLHTRTCALCEEICAKCAASCDLMGDDPAMKACADECRRCAESCRRMAGVAA
jgi:hypothetical protein